MIETAVNLITLLKTSVAINTKDRTLATQGFDGALVELVLFSNIFIALICKTPAMTRVFSPNIATLPMFH